MYPASNKVFPEPGDIPQCAAPAHPGPYNSSNFMRTLSASCLIYRNHNVDIVKKPTAVAIRNTAADAIGDACNSHAHTPAANDAIQIRNRRN